MSILIFFNYEVMHMLDKNKKEQLDAVIELQRFLGPEVNIIGFDTSSDLGSEIDTYITNKVGPDNYHHNSHTVELQDISKIAFEYLDKKESLRNEIRLKVKNLGIPE